MATYQEHPTLLRDILGDELIVTSARTDYFFEEQSRRRGLRPAGHVSNSSHYACLYSTQAPRMGVAFDEGSDTFDPEQAYQNAMGDAVHEVLQDTLWNAGITLRTGQWKPDDAVKKEVTFGKHNLSPEMYQKFVYMDYSLRADMAADFGGEVVWGEFKSKAKRYFDGSYMSSNYMEEALLDAEMQLQMALGFSEAKYGVMIFVNRELDKGQRIPAGESITLKEYHVYTVEADPEYFNFRVDQISKEVASMRKGILPVPNNHAGSCGFCKVKQLCPVPKEWRRSTAPRWYPGILEDEKLKKFLKSDFKMLEQKSVVSVK